MTILSILGGLLSFFITGVLATIAFMVWGWWFLFWVFLGAIALTVFAEVLAVIADPFKEEGPDRL